VLRDLALRTPPNAGGGLMELLKGAAGLGRRIPSTLDPRLAPAGKHVASLFVQHVAPHLRPERRWTDEGEKEAFADLVIETVNRHAPNFKASVIARQVLSPLDLERRFGMVDGDIFHGALSLNQLFSAPAPIPAAA
jgi:phytoene dehydrogenase-like protein